MRCARKRLLVAALLPAKASLPLTSFAISRFHLVLCSVVVGFQLLSIVTWAQDYRALLRSGQRHAEAKQWEAAVADLQAARQIKPNDAEVLSELSYAFFMTKHLSEAKLSAEQAVKFAANDKLQAASLYNLGRIMLAQGDDEFNVIEAFEKSLELRYSEETARHLLTIDDQTSAIICRTPRPLESVCACFTKMQNATCTIDETPLQPDARIVEANWTMAVPSTGRSTLFLAIRFADGWSVVKNLGRERDSNPVYWNISDVKLKMRTSNGKRNAELHYMRSEENVACDHRSGKELGVKKLRAEVEVSCRTETQHLEDCSIDEKEHSVACVDYITEIKYTESAHNDDDIPAKLLKQVQRSLSKKNCQSKADLHVDDKGRFAGSEIPAFANEGTCPAPRPIK